MDRPIGPHHIAYLTHDTAATVKFYTDVLGMKFVGYAQEDSVPSTGESYRFFHSFLEMEGGSCIAFFELEGLENKPDETIVPKWVRHLALQVPSEDALLKAKAELEARGIDVIGVTDHGFCHSIYFFDPNGIRLELTSVVRPFDDTDASDAQAALDKWEATKKPATV